ncbi:MAG TPA: uroporphyrinogen-III synthase, partial [Polyangiales bacterium]|nr:uroporphyrinogen-III synthase [Polyangiales bacterium]
AGATARPRGLVGLRVVSFESRRAQDLGLLIRQNGAEICYAPATREVPLADEQAILDFGTQLFQGNCDSLVLFTGIGTTILIDALCTRWPRASVLAQLQHTALLCRGPKPASALRAAGLTPRLVAPEPHGERELLACIDREFALGGRRVFVQDYGSLPEEFLDGLRARGASVTLVQVYRWALPADPRALQHGLNEIVSGNADVAIFTSTHQVDNAFEYAARVALLQPLREALSGPVLVASLGTVTNEALMRQGVHADLSPEQPKLGALVDCLARAAAALQFEKRRQLEQRRQLGRRQGL